MNIPEKISGFNVYDAGSKLVGVADEITLPDFTAVTTAISGAGILGEYDSPMPGHFSSMVLEIPMRAVGGEFASLAGGMQDLTLRGSIEGTDLSTATVREQAMKVNVRGPTKEFKPGKLKVGEGMEASVTVEVLYIKIEVAGLVVVELDKHNYIYKVGGKDLLADIRRNI